MQVLPPAQFFAELIAAPRTKVQQQRNQKRHHQPASLEAVGAQGPQGLLAENKKVIIIAARGGAYSGESPVAFLDQQEPYLRTIFGFIGLKNVQLVYAESQAMGQEAAESGLKTAISSVLAFA